MEAQQFNEIRIKKPSYPVTDALRGYLDAHGRAAPLPIGYTELLRHDGLMPQVDAAGRPTLWTTVLLRPQDQAELHEQLVDLYQMVAADGRRIDYLKVASIDFCAYGNSQPFRIKILNQINDNHDYYYIKKADASRVYGLELEHLLSPNKINYMVHRDTLVEEHIIGVPGDTFMQEPERYGAHLSPVRLSKEFVKFNERCFARLLGDMRAYNFVVDVIQDFDQVQYRLRSIDFDQQSYDGRHRIYLPQFYKENLPFVEFAQQYISYETAAQYSNEERALLRKRYLLAQSQIEALIAVMKDDVVSTEEHVAMLARELSVFHGDVEMGRCRSMGAVLERHLALRLELR
ncbi:MAG: hypothetical protein KA352_01155 [Flavobacteriales bacterium]|nr:hypothetical protein [Flavobacteriales bacterium]